MTMHYYYSLTPSRIVTQLCMVWIRGRYSRVNASLTQMRTSVLFVVLLIAMATTVPSQTGAVPYGDRARCESRCEGDYDLCQNLGAPYNSCVRYRTRCKQQCWKGGVRDLPFVVKELDFVLSTCQRCIWSRVALPVLIINSGWVMEMPGCRQLSFTNSTRGGQWYPENRGVGLRKLFARSESRQRTESRRLVFFLFGSEVAWVSGSDFQTRVSASLGSYHSPPPQQATAAIIRFSAVRSPRSWVQNDKFKAVFLARLHVR